jgi:hypothetical protein
LAAVKMLDGVECMPRGDTPVVVSSIHVGLSLGRAAGVTGRVMPCSWGSRGV